jgi:uncharacterized caspase-like protein
MAGNDWAIVIGINEYDFLPTEEHLKYAVNDAVKVRQFLYEQAKFPQENVLLCCDGAPGTSPQQRPSRNALRHLLKNEIQKAKGAHNFWFFYAGHGIVHDHQDFLLPCDGNPNDLRDTAIPISFVTDCLRDCGADHVVLVMDMCRNRTRSADEGSRGIDEVMGEQTQQIAKAEGIVTLFSCSRGERSYEIGDLEQGAFTYALLEGLQQGTTPRALEHYLTQRVSALNRQHGKPIQTPRVIPEPGWKYDRPLLLSCATPADIHQLAVEARDAELEEQDYEKAKALWWQVIEADRSTSNDRAKARRAIDRINHTIHQKAEADKQRQAEEARQKAAERQRKLERQQELEQQRQELASEEGIDYTKLRDFLQTNQWKQADKETYRLMITAVDKKEGDWFNRFDLKYFPRQDLRTIDQLWVKYSNGKWGFSVQKQIWQKCGSPIYFTAESWEKFRDRVGWRKHGQYVRYDQLSFNPQKSPPGEFPALADQIFHWWRGVDVEEKSGAVTSGFGSFWGSLFSREDL